MIICQLKNENMCNMYKCCLTSTLGVRESVEDEHLWASFAVDGLLKMGG